LSVTEIEERSGQRGKVDALIEVHLIAAKMKSLVVRH
jgi:hypothetical protein